MKRENKIGLHISPCFKLRRHVKACVKPVLNWANVCSRSILRTVRRTMIRFLIELLTRRTWFRQFDELYFVLNWLVMKCKFRPELAAVAQQTAWSKMQAKVKSVYFNHPSQGNSTNYYLILGPRDKAAPPTSQQINKFPPKRVKNPAIPSFLIHRRVWKSNQRQCSSNSANVPRTCWVKLFGPRI